MQSPESPVPVVPLELARVRVERAADGWSIEVPELWLPAGGATALLGPSGCGKTSLLMALLGLAPALDVTGVVQLLGDRPPPPGSARWRAQLRGDIALVMQDGRAALDPLRPMGDQLTAATGVGLADASAALQALDVDDPAVLLGRYPHQVSGGEAQRCCLAVAWLRRARLVVADEPTASLDGPRAAEVVAGLRQLQDRGTGLLLATHEVDVVAALDADPLVFSAGRFVASPLPSIPWPAPPPHGALERAPLLSCAGLGVRRQARWILRDFDFELRPGEVVALVGPSGAGKTTAAMVLAGHLRPTAGSVQRAVVRGGVQMLFQDAHGSLTPGRTVAQLVREVAIEGFDMAAEAAALALPAAQLQRTVAELSGGERRRAALLRALAVRPQVLILDEPTASLDRETAVGVLDAVWAARRSRGIAVLLITHDRELARVVADRVVTLEQGRTVEAPAVT